MKQAFLAVLLLTGATAWADGAPKIKFDRHVYDFGVTSLVQSVTGTFTFQNVGDGELKLEKPRPTCGCTVAKFTSDSLKPGEKGELVFTIALTTGDQLLEKHIVVSSNDPENPGISLVTRVETKAVFKAEPAGVLTFGDVRLGSTTNAVVTIRRLDGKKPAITKAESSSKVIRTHLEPVKNATRLHVTLDSQAPPRQISGMIKLFTADSKGPAFMVFVTAYLTGGLKLEPQALVWGMPDPDNWPDKEPEIILSRSFTVSATDPKQRLELRNVTTSIPDMKVEVETIEEGQEYEIEATLAHRLKEPLQGTINFETNLPDLPKVEVPVEVNIWRN